MKRSGLADSPFFTKPSPLPVHTEDDGMAADVPVQTQEVFKRTDAQLHKRMNAQTFNSTNEPLNERTNAQTSGTSTNPPSRLTTRESFDIYADQLEAFEELRLRSKKQRGKHITKGELMRELLEEILQAKK
jgi:hypothetical protein